MPLEKNETKGCGRKVNHLYPYQPKFSGATRVGNPRALIEVMRRKLTPGPKRVLSTLHLNRENAIYFRGQMTEHNGDELSVP